MSAFFVPICRERVGAAGGLALLSGLAVACPALAFDCAKAKSPVERAICSDPATKAADDAMNDAFSAVRARLDAAGAKALLSNQRAWLKNRDATCLGDDQKSRTAQCLRGENDARARALFGRPEEGPGTPVAPVPVFVERPGTKTTYAVSLMLYRFPDPQTSAERRLNAWADVLIAKAPTRTDDPSGTFSYSYDQKAQIAYGSDRLLSVALTGYEFAGGAHGQSLASAVAIDMRAGRELAMADLLAKPQLGEITAFCRDEVGREVRSRLTDSGENPDTSAEARASLKDILQSAAESIVRTVADLGSWRFGAKAATVTFVTDTIGPHVLGEFSCTVPYDRLRPLAKPEFPLP